MSCNNCSSTYCCVTWGPWVSPRMREMIEARDRIQSHVPMVEDLECFEDPGCVDFWEMRYGVLSGPLRLAVYTNPPSRK